MHHLYQAGFSISKVMYITPRGSAEARDEGGPLSLQLYVSEYYMYYIILPPYGRLIEKLLLPTVRWSAFDAAATYPCSILRSVTLVHRWQHNGWRAWGGGGSQASNRVGAGAVDVVGQRLPGGG